MWKQKVWSVVSEGSLLFHCIVCVLTVFIVRTQNTRTFLYVVTESTNVHLDEVI